MEAYDPEKAARVWQRVLGDSPPTPKYQGLLPLIMEEQTDAATYLALSRRFQGKPSAQLRRMAEEEQSHAACLQGLCRLTEGTRPAVKTPPLTQEATEALLRRCCGREMRCLAEYEGRSSDPEYGPVYALLAAQEREHCRLLLELLGGLK